MLTGAGSRWPGRVMVAAIIGSKVAIAVFREA